MKGHSGGGDRNKSGRPRAGDKNAGGEKEMSRVRGLRGVKLSRIREMGLMGERKRGGGQGEGRKGGGREGEREEKRRF